MTTPSPTATRPAPSSGSGLAVSSMVCGILGLFTLGLTSIIAVITGHLALSKIKSSNGAIGGRGMAIAGLVTGYLGLLLGIGALVVLVLLRQVAQGAKVSRSEADFRMIEASLKMHQLTSGSLPTTEQGLQALVDQPTRHPIPQQWTRTLASVPLDAWGNPYLYRASGSIDPNRYEILCSGPDGIAGNDDDLSSQAKP